MKFINFMFVLLGIVGLSLIIISILTLLFFKDLQSISASISYLSFSTGILYLLFIFTIYKISKKIN